MQKFVLFFYRAFLFLFFTIPCLLNAQEINDYGFEYWNQPTVSVNGSIISNPWAGGINNVQAGLIDLNMDSQNDLVLFDRHGSRILPFIFHDISLRSPQPWYEYAPDYIKYFPPVNSIFQLKDYNGDYKPDLFTYTTGGIMVYKNVSGQSIKFQQVTYPFIRSLQGNIFTNLLVTNVDYPGIYDLDGDRDLDIISFWGLGSFMELHRNMSVETFGNPDSLLYHKVDDCWGRFAEGVESNEIYLDTCSRERPDYRHTGSTITLLDINNDSRIDLLLGDVDFLNIQALINSGTNLEAVMTEHFDHFPETNPVELASFPAVITTDIFNDSIPDLLVSPFEPGLIRSAGTNSLWMYEFQDTSYVLKKKNFLQEDMIDIGLGIYPVFAEITGDTLTDLLVGNYGSIDTCFYNINGQLTCEHFSSVSLYMNTGTKAHPAFTLLTDDIAGLAGSGSLNIYPAVSDLNDDGKNDLLIGNSAGELFLFTTLNYASNIPQFSAPVRIDASQAGTFITPALADIDDDGLTDIITGNKTGKLCYIRNAGTLQQPQFSFITADYGKVNVTDSTQSYTGYSTPAFITDSQGRLRLVVGSESGRFHYFPVLSSDPNQKIAEEPDIFSSLSDGIRSSAAFSDLNNDGFTEMLAGNYSGGLKLFKGILPGPSAIAETQKLQPLQLIPNPASNLVKVILPESGNWNIRIYDIYGRLVQENTMLNDVTILPLEINESGLFMVVAYCSDKVSQLYSGKLLIIQ